MKRAYLFLALLLTFVGISVTRAIVITVDDDAEPKTESTLTDGDNVVIRMRISNYNDWAGYWAVLPTKVEDDPFEEFYQYLLFLPIHSYPIGNDPGCVNEIEAAQSYNELIAMYSNELDYEHDDDYWIQALADLKAAVESMSTVSYKPVTDGYYRIASAKNGNYMYLDNNGDGGCRPAPDTPSLNDLWQVYTNAEGETCMKNLGTMKYIVPVAANAKAMKGDYEEHSLEITCRNTLIVANQTLAKAPFNIHCGNYLHTQGTNLLVWWDAASLGDMWMFETVTTDDLMADFGNDIMTQLELSTSYSKLLIDALNIIEEAKTAGNELLITSADQISSPRTEANEGSIAALIDGDYETFWHSSWANGPVNDNPGELALHYLQFDLGKALDNVTMKYVRRPVINDHPTQFRISASNEADGEYTVITEFPVIATEPGNSGANDVLYSYDLDLGAEYQYLRVQATMTDYWRGYWHASELYFVNVVADLWALVQTEGEALEAAIAAFKTAVADGGLTQDIIDALQDAYDTFVNAYSNINTDTPTAVESALTGTQPSTTYLLDGRRAAQNAKGLVIRDGRKLLVK